MIVKIVSAVTNALTGFILTVLICPAMNSNIFVIIPLPNGYAGNAQITSVKNVTQVFFTNLKYNAAHANITFISPVVRSPRPIRMMMILKNPGYVNLADLLSSLLPK